MLIHLFLGLLGSLFPAASANLGDCSKLADVPLRQVLFYERPSTPAAVASTLRNHLCGLTGVEDSVAKLRKEIKDLQEDLKAATDGQKKKEIEAKIKEKKDSIPQAISDNWKAISDAITDKKFAFDKDGNFTVTRDALLKSVTAMQKFESGPSVNTLLPFQDSAKDLEKTAVANYKDKKYLSSADLDVMAEGEKTGDVHDIVAMICAVKATVGLAPASAFDFDKGTYRGITGSAKIKAGKTASVMVE